VSSIDDLLIEVRARLPQRPRAEEVATIQGRGGLLIDIRPIDLRERDGELPGALVVGRNVLEWRLDPTSAHRIAEVTDAEQEIVIFCDEGYASSLAAETLQRLGLRHATDLDGGFQAWKHLPQG
jgi:rhodanese-related sulfurtransferase